MKGFLNLSSDASDESFHVMNCASDNITFSEQLELQFLSDELDIAIADNGENPRLDVSAFYLGIFFGFLMIYFQL